MFAAHHVLWLEKLQEVADGKLKRLLGLMPPGSSKSLFTSVCFPTYYLGRFPGSKIIVTGYGSDLPKKFGRWARNIVSTDRYKRIFNCTISDESAAVDEWALTNGSEWYARGILAGITGQRADGIIWDDLIKGRDEADSKLIKDKTWDAYLNDLQTRRNSDDTFEIGINTRWSEDDPPGRILPQNYNGQTGWVKGQDSNDWYVVCLPAICEQEDDPLGRKIGDRLWPEHFSERHYAPFKLDARTWSSLFQQRPAPETGTFFEEKWIKLYGSNTLTSVPDRDTMHVYGASDYATTQGGGDYTVHIVVGVDQYHDIYVLDLWRKRVSSDKWVEAFCDLVEEWKPIGWAEEQGQIKAGVGPFLHRMLLDRRIYIARRTFPTKGSKEIRAQSIRGRMAQGKVYFPVDKPWFSDLKRELMLFPAGTHDDIVDALALIGQILDLMIRGEPKKKDKERQKLLSMELPVSGLADDARGNECSLTLEDLFLDNEKHEADPKNLRIW